MTKLPVIINQELYIYEVSPTKEANTYLSFLEKELQEFYEKDYMVKDYFKKQDYFRLYKEIDVKGKLHVHKIEKIVNNTESKGTTYKVLVKKEPFLVTVLKDMMQSHYIDLDDLMRLISDYKWGQFYPEKMNEAFTEKEQLLGIESFRTIIDQYFHLLDWNKNNYGRYSEKDIELLKYTEQDLQIAKKNRLYVSFLPEEVEKRMIKK